MACQAVKGREIMKEHFRKINLRIKSQHGAERRMERLPFKVDFPGLGERRLPCKQKGRDASESPLEGKVEMMALWCGSV
jgi:hypothetical protein